MKRGVYDELVLALFPTARGFAFALFAAPLTPIDWGFRRLRKRNKNAQALLAIEKLCDALKPDILVIENCEDPASKRRRRIRRLNKLIATFAQSRNIPITAYFRIQVRETFSQTGAISRYEIAQAIATYIPALAHRLPPVRRLWQAEDERLSLFDAAALTLTHFAIIPQEEEPP